MANNMWQQLWETLPAGVKVSADVEASANNKIFLFYPWYPSVRLIEGEGTPADVAYSRMSWDVDYLEAYRNAVNRIAGTDGLKLQSRADAVTLYYMMVERSAEGEQMYHPVLGRPVYPLAHLLGIMSDLQDRMDNYSHLPDSDLLLRVAIRDLLRQSAFRLSDILMAYIGPQSVGLTVEEKNAALKSAESSISTETRDEILHCWANVGGDETEFSLLWLGYTIAMREAMEQISRHTPTYKGPWGREAVQNYLIQMLIPHTPEVLLTWAEEQAMAIESVMNQIAALIQPGSTDWKQVVQTYPFDNLPQNDAQLLARYQQIVPTVIARLQETGLLPKTPKGCFFELGWTPAESEPTIPTAACRPAPRLGEKRVSRLFVTHTYDNPQLLRRQRFGDEPTAGHEGSHAYQGFFSDQVPSVFTSAQTISIYGFEGHAFASELMGFKHGAYTKDLMTLLNILQGRLWRALRVIFELKYHLDTFASVEELVKEYGERAWMTYDDAMSDCQRSMAMLGQFSGYYIGAAMAECLIEKAGRENEVKTLRDWLETTGALAAPSLYAWMIGLTNKPEELFQTLPLDAGVAYWNEIRNEYVK